ncbi:MAG: hypothetical protein GWM98_06145, partial [Nitrospinaceae bacterium]|nr:hypothetical protein [Nitrospinaceae bacterium]NIR54144.1 hypothetical protein [Nitrospinaceae bacterium]NIS84558.1 hypothetical protein [Nitrospinaceae bacterium]NIT81350.1 hypothetical protein [Nitrospinaceae bacterium]NIU43637.1 hypothetical protein [Nitrospinaceae bacterium]
MGRFFLHLMENELRKAEIPEFLFPVFASSVHNLLGDERYLPLAQKIENLLDRGRQKGLGYDEIL